jgi:hypothetical protein
MNYIGYTETKQVDFARLHYNEINTIICNMVGFQVFIPQVCSEILGEQIIHHTLCKDPTNDDQLNTHKTLQTYKELSFF